jgi:hypothetical protein
MDGLYAVRRADDVRPGKKIATDHSAPSAADLQTSQGGSQDAMSSRAILRSLPHLRQNWISPKKNLPRAKGKDLTSRRRISYSAPGARPPCIGVAAILRGSGTFPQLLELYCSPVVGYAGTRAGAEAKICRVVVPTAFQRGSKIS